MDAAGWIGAASGLAGAVVGAGGSIATTLVAQRHQRAEARRGEKAQLVRETIDAITREFVDLKELAATYPPEDALFGDVKTFRLMANKHHQTIEIALVRLPDRELAVRIGDILNASRMAFQGDKDSYQRRIQGAHAISYEGLSCLGAFLRGDPLPPPTEYTQAATAHRLDYEARLRARPELAQGDAP